MAESYRGLTIRIGADTSKLSSALREANGAITAASNQARRLKQALNMDPGNLSAATKQVSVMGDQMSAIGQKLAILQRGYADVYNQQSKSAQNGGKTYGELAKTTDDAALSVENLKSQYNGLTSTLGNYYRRLTAISKNVGTGKTFKVTEGTTDIEKIEREYEHIIERRNQLMALDNRSAKQDKELKRVEKQSEEYGKLLEQIRPLKQAFLEVSDAYDDAKTVAQLQDVQVEAEKTKSQMMQLGTTMLSMGGSGISQGMDHAKDDLKSISGSIDEAGQRAKAFGQQMSLTPSGIVATVHHMSALRDQSNATYQKASLLRGMLSQYKAAGIDKVAAQTKNAGEAAETAKRAYAESIVSIKTLKGDISNAVNEQKKLANEGKTGTEEYKRLGDRIAETKQKLQDAYKAGTGLKEAFDQSQAVVEFNNLNQELGETSEKLNAIGNGKLLANVGSSALLLGEQVGQYAKQGLTEVVEATTTLDTAYADMRKTVNGTEEEFQHLYDAAVAASKVQPVTADTILSIEALGGQLGFANDGLGRLEEFGEVVSGLDIATNMDWQTAGTYMAQFFNIFDTNKDLVENYGSALVDLGNHFATTESDISQMSARIAAAGTSIGMSEADVLGLSTALASMGVRAEAGGSSISTIMTNIDKSVAMGTEGIKKYANDMGMGVSEYITYLGSIGDSALEEIADGYDMTVKSFKAATLDAAQSVENWADVAGYKSAAEFAAAWEADPIQALTDIFMGLDEAVDAEGNLAIMLDDLGIKSIRQLDISRRLASNPRLLADAIETANRAWEENTALTTEVEKRNESLSARVETLKNIITSVKTELGEGLSPLVDFAIDKMTGLADVLSNMDTDSKSQILGVVSSLAAFVTVTPIIRGVGGALAKLLADIAMFAGTATLTPWTLGISAALIGILAVYEKFVKPAREAKKASEEFNAALKVTRDTADTIGGSMSSGKRAVKSFGDVAKDEAMSVKELTDEIESFNDRMSSISKPVEESNALLGEYQTVIDKFAGKGRATAEDMALLQWAVDGINEALGTNYSAQDVLMDKYSDEEGEIDNLCSYIDKLIEKRQAQARADAAQDLYTESLKEQMKAEQNLTKAQEEYGDAVEKRNKIIAEDRDGGNQYRTQKEILENANRIMESEYGIDMSEVEANLSAAEDAYVELGGAVEDYKNLMIESAKETYDASEIMAKFTQGAFSDQDFAWGKALERNNIGLEEFAKACEEAEISASDLQTIYDDKDVFFADMVDESAGSIDNLIDTINKYKSEHPSLDLEVDDATAHAQELEAQVRQSTGNMALDIRSFVTEEMPQLGQALQDSGVNDITYWSNKLADAGVTVDDLASMGEDGFARLAEGCNGNVDKMIEKIVEFNGKKLTDKNVKITAGGNVVDGTASLAVQNLVDFQNRLRDRNVTYKATVTTSGDLSTAAALAEKFRAAGGIRYHADGMILNRPTWIGNRDVAGEAGAEAIIPLTNRRYVQPFADTVADGMMSKLGQMAGTTNNYVINGLTVAPDSALAKAMDATFDEAKRLSRMGRR